MQTLTIDPEFRALIPPLTADERAQLEANLLAEGCRDPLVVWAQPDRTCVLLDGHHRYDICQQHGLTFSTVLVDKVTTRQEAVNWIINNQLGRRNLTPQQASSLRGKRYNLEKKAEGRPKKLADTQPVSGPTANRLAREYKVSPSTIKEDGQFAEAVDTITEALGPDIQESLLAGEVSWGKERLIRTVQQLHEAEAYPFLNSVAWKPYEKLEALEILRGFPAEERPGITSLLTDVPGWEALRMLRNLRAWPPTDRQALYRTAQSPDARDRALALSRAAERPPRPDPQLGWIRQAQATLTKLTGELSQCYRQFPNDPWASRLKGIVGQLRTLRDGDLLEITAEIEARHAARTHTPQSGDALEELRRRV
jgi:transposase-like protein